MSYLNRIILLIDMDCFYCQVEEKLNPKLKDKPIAVVQANEWRGGGIIAVNYCARDKGVTRHMRGDEAKQKCPDIHLVKVPQVRGKADLTKYRDAGKEVADVLLTLSSNLERASVDEAYLDISDIVEQRISSNCSITRDKLKNTFVVGSPVGEFIANVNTNIELDDNNKRLAVGAIIAEEIREKIFAVTHYTCSVGIAHNKVLAKLVCGLHKPNRQTILPYEALPLLYKDMPIKKLKGLGGKLGSEVSEKLNIVNMGELIHFNQKDLIKLFDEKIGTWLFDIARGIDMEPVNTRLLAKSISCCKQFQGRSALITQKDVEHWLNELSEELHERLNKDLEENNRRARQMVVSFSQNNPEQSHCTRSLPLNSNEKLLIYNNFLNIIQKHCKKSDGSFSIRYLGIGATNFEPMKKTKDIKFFFQNMKETNSHVTEYKKYKTNATSESEIINQTASIANDILIDEDSCYLSETQNEGKDDTTYVYFEEVHPESVKNQSFVDADLSNSSINSISDDSIKDEVYIQNSDNTVRKQNIASFFSNFYDRTFDTSKCFKQTGNSFNVDINSSNETTIDETNVITSECHEENVKINSNNNVNLVDGDNINKCPMCNKLLSSKEYQTHMDYHFALKMVKDEEHLYSANLEISKNINSLDEKSTNIKTNKNSFGNKRKQLNEKSKSILGYFQNQTNEINTDLCKICKECNKQVLIENYDVHMDFHLAKKNPFRTKSDPFYIFKK